MTTDGEVQLWVCKKDPVKYQFLGQITALSDIKLKTFPILIVKNLANDKSFTFFSLQNLKILPIFTQILALKNTFYKVSVSPTLSDIF